MLNKVNLSVSSNVLYYLKHLFIIMLSISETTMPRRVWRYQRGKQNPQIEEGETTQWPKGQTTVYKT